ncbi:MAG: 50S ribosomal protein L37ae [DPANN group archaeon]|nr:50S ribosomal protein L37ae [DPANN group archaeon]
MATKKVGSTGRWGARYGLKLRKSVLKIEKIQRGRHKCPFCEKLAVKRLATGIWFCRSCESKFAGRAYEPGISHANILPTMVEEPVTAEVSE